MSIWCPLLLYPTDEINRSTLSFHTHIYIYNMMSLSAVYIQLTISSLCGGGCTCSGGHLAGKAQVHGPQLRRGHVLRAIVRGVLLRLGRYCCNCHHGLHGEVTVSKSCSRTGNWANSFGYDIDRSEIEFGVTVVTVIMVYPVRFNGLLAVVVTPIMVYTVKFIVRA